MPLDRAVMQLQLQQHNSTRRAAAEQQLLEQRTQMTHMVHLLRPVAWVLMQQGLGDQEALLIGAIVGGVAARLYRYARVRWPWLAELDPPAEANSLQ